MAEIEVLKLLIIDILHVMTSISYIEAFDFTKNVSDNKARYKQVSYINIVDSIFSRGGWSRIIPV